MEFLFDLGDFPYEGTERLSEALDRELSGRFSSDVPLRTELIVVSEQEIKELNARYRNKDSVTDVLSFPELELKEGAIKKQEHLDSFDGDALILGSVVICKKRAEEQAAEYGHSFKREVFYLAVHGILHCLGYDHETEQERAVMRMLEEAVMTRLDLPREA